MLSWGAISISVLSCLVQSAHGPVELNRRIGLIEAERARGRLAIAESMADDFQAEVERNGAPDVWLASAFREHGLLLDDAGLPGEAIPFYQRALALLRTHPESAVPLVGLTLANLAIAHVDLGDPALGLSLSEEAMARLRESARPESAIALYAHGFALHGLGRNLEALRDLRTALEVWERFPGADYSQLALVKDAMAASLEDLGYDHRAQAAAEESVAIRAAAFGPDSPGLGASLNNLGVIQARAGLYSDSEESLRRAAGIFEQLRDGGIHQLHTALANLAGVYSLEARTMPAYLPKAEAIYRRELAVEEQLFGPSDLRVSGTLEQLGETLYRERAYDEAGAFYRRGLALQVAALGRADPRTQAASKRYQVMARKIGREADR